MAVAAMIPGKLNVVDQCLVRSQARFVRQSGIVTRLSACGSASSLAKQLLQRTRQLILHNFVESGRAEIERQRMLGQAGQCDARPLFSGWCDIRWRACSSSRHPPVASCFPDGSRPGSRMQTPLWHLRPRGGQHGAGACRKMRDHCPGCLQPDIERNGHVS
jgi:hypothetical protein